MDANQNLGATNGNQLNTTGNPQDVGAPTLLPSTGNLQGLAVTSSNLNTSGTSGIRLSGQTIFTPDTSSPTNKSSHTAYVFGGLVAVLILAGLVAVAMRWAKHSTQ